MVRPTVSFRALVWSPKSASPAFHEVRRWHHGCVAAQALARPDWGPDYWCKGPLDKLSGWHRWGDAGRTLDSLSSRPKYSAARWGAVICGTTAQIQRFTEHGAWNGGTTLAPESSSFEYGQTGAGGAARGRCNEWLVRS